AVQADDDVAEAQAGLRRGTADQSAEDQRAVAVDEAERERQRQLDRLHVDAQPALQPVGGLAAHARRELDEAALWLGGLLRRVLGTDGRRLLRRRRGGLAAGTGPRRHAHHADAVVGGLVEQRALALHLREGWSGTGRHRRKQR